MSKIADFIGNFSPFYHFPAFTKSIYLNHLSGFFLFGIGLWRIFAAIFLFINAKKQVKL